MNIAYKTDHHYTAYGSHRYYEDIIATLSENFKLGEPYKYEEPICFNDYFVKYRGSYARRTAFFSGGYDQLCDVDYNLNEYLLYSDGQRIETISTLEKYLETKGAHVMDSDHYRVLHGGVNSGTLHYLFEQNELNALFLIDSNIVPIADVLASHFNNTYYVDTRIEDYFKLEDFVEEHDIDFVFVALMYKNYYDNDGYYINIR
jgi:hypothetical protein